MTDGQRIIRAINRAEEIHDGLRVRGGLRSHNGPSSPGASGSRPPVDISMMDLAHFIESLLQGWAILVHEEQGDDMPANRIEAQSLYLRQRAIWISGAGWAPDMCDELEDAARRGVGMLGLLPPRSVMPEPCKKCAHRQWIYHERPPMVRCAEGHETKLGEHLDGRGTESLTHAQAAWVLGVKRTAVSMAVKRGKLIAGTDGGVTLDSIRERLAESAA